MPFSKLSIGAILAVLAACDAPPEYLALAGSPPTGEAAPALLPIDELLVVAQRPTAPVESTDDIERTQERAAALEARAAALSQESVVDDQTRAAMQDALARRSSQ